MSVETGKLEPDAVRTMFDRIAPVYDFMNRAMTAGLDQRWRAATAGAVVSPGDRVLDSCCGTGDLAVAAQGAGGRVTGLDFSERMLERARTKSDEVEWVRGDALALPFADDSFDAATVGFGVRNLEDLEGGLRELRRVLRPGGRVGILEITQPRGLVRLFYKLWFDGLVPLAGKMLPGGSAYTYLPPRNAEARPAIRQAAIAKLKATPSPSENGPEISDGKNWCPVRCAWVAAGS